MVEDLDLDGNTFVKSSFDGDSLVMPQVLVVSEAHE